MYVICLEVGAFIDIKNFSELNYHSIGLQNYGFSIQKNFSLTSDESYTYLTHDIYLKGDTWQNLEDH